jgi:proton-translocating NADH-quinone oxidoreductase chain L
MFSLIAFITLFLFGRHLGKQIALGFAIFMAFISFIICFYYFIQVFFYGQVYTFILGSWVSVGTLEITYKFIIDPLSITFGTLISFITLLILIYSYDYLHEDPNLVKFFAYLSFFSFAMSCLVFAGNYFIMFLGWEAVGLASYLLINFWTTRNQANQSALKAIIFNRVGDIAFISAMGIIYYLFNSFDLEDLELLAHLYVQTTFSLFSYNVPTLELVALFLFLAAAAKSAQLFAHPWLPDAMEGPTPVSALLHSATMVTAGVFLILRSSVIFSHAPYVSLLVACIGLITANISSLTGLLQYDIKRIIAFSTCSQLGFMMFATGIGNYSIALFHLVNHAFFKALLFLCAGSVIHATGQQDIRRMGALFKALPITYIAMLLASLSLIGFPFLSGFYSKDFLLEVSYNVFGMFSFVIYFISTLSTAISSFYSFRLIYFVFLGDQGSSMKTLKTVSESSYFLYIPLIILSILSIFSGYYLKDLMAVQTSLYNFPTSPFTDTLVDQDFMGDLYKALPTIFSLFGLVLVYIIYSKINLRSQSAYRKYLLLPYLSCKKFFADAFNSFYIFLPSASFSLNITYKLIDQGILEQLGPSGIYSFIESIFNSMVTVETTLIIYRSFLFIIFCLGAALTIFLGLQVLLLVFFLIITRIVTEEELSFE